MLKADPAFAEAYLAAAFDVSDLPGVQFVLRHIDETQGMHNLAEKAGMPREEPLSRAVIQGKSGH